MSCFVRIATQITDEHHLREAVDAVGYTIRKGTDVRGWMQQTTAADFVIDTGTKYDVGAVKNGDETWSFVSDWSMSSVKQDAFVNQLTQRYSAIRVAAKAKKQGYVVAREKVEQDGTIRLLLRKFV
jgi:hypothetical protein